MLRSRTSTILLPVVCWQQVLAVEAGGRVGPVCGPTQEELLVAGSAAPAGIRELRVAGVLGDPAQ